MTATEPVKPHPAYPAMPMPSVEPTTFQEQQRIAEEAAAESRRRSDIATAMDHAQKTRARAAGRFALRVWPNPIGELVNRECQAYAEFGYRVNAGGQSFMEKLITYVLTQEAPAPVLPGPPAPGTTVVHRIEVE